VCTHANDLVTACLILASGGRNNMTGSGSELEITQDINDITVYQSAGMFMTGTGDGVVLIWRV